MKKTLSIMLTLALALTLVICFVIPAGATPGEQNGDSLAVVQPGGGAYVIVTNLEPGDLDFNYGWNNSSNFASAALGYWLGVYDITGSTYVWSSENQFTEPDPKMLKLSSLDTSTLVSGHDYAINFFVRDAYNESGQGTSNVTEVQVYFTAP
jgi:hypothetical protein